MKQFLSKTGIVLTAIAMTAGGFMGAQAQHMDGDVNLRGVTPNYNYGSVAQVDPGFHPASAAPAKKSIYLYNPDYPPVNLIAHPPKPQAQTNFLKLLDLELQKGQQLTLTENIENADYRVNLECAGITNCSELRVFVLTPKRDVLTGFSIKNIASRFGFKRKPMDDVISELSETLEKRISQIEQGDYGYSHY